MFLSRLTQDIQGDIRHPVDYLVDLIETKVGDKLRPGTRGRWWVGCDASASLRDDVVVLHDIFLGGESDLY